MNNSCIASPMESYPIDSIVCDIFKSAIRSKYDMRGFTRIPSNKYIIETFGKTIAVTISVNTMDLQEL